MLLCFTKLFAFIKIDTQYLERKGIPAGLRVVILRCRIKREKGFIATFSPRQDKLDPSLLVRAVQAVGVLSERRWQEPILHRHGRVSRPLLGWHRVIMHRAEKEEGKKKRVQFD